MIFDEFLLLTFKRYVPHGKLLIMGGEGSNEDRDWLVERGYECVIEPKAVFKFPSQTFDGFVCKAGFVFSSPEWLGYTLRSLKRIVKPHGTGIVMGTYVKNDDARKKEDVWFNVMTEEGFQCIDGFYDMREYYSGKPDYVIRRSYFLKIL
ncbi:hypothetical protein HY967_03400 [Candidatus Jorgensenbacteria bacterium]|nr:hypothetical protein [Candidatus Jorgensenbacteria bacterium]